MRDFYDVLGLPTGLEREAYLEKYTQLKAEYSEAMFLPGEEGNTAAKKLTELETAFRMLEAELQRQEASEEFGSEFGQIDGLIKEGRYDEAQVLLDSVMTRNAEWHYYQSAVFYKREWMGESRKHLATAVGLEPDNEKYRSALEKLDIKMGTFNAPPQSFGDYQHQEQGDRLCNSNNLTNCCMAYCCLDCCCSMAQCCG